MNILPYTHIDGVPTLRDSDLEALYLQVLEEGKVEDVWYDGSVRCPEDFIAFFKRGSFHLHLVQNEKRETIAFFWISDLEEHTCRIHFCGFKKHWKSFIRAGEAALKFLSPHFVLIRGVTPVSNKMACKFIQRVGMKTLGVMPDRIYNFYKERIEDALITYYQAKEE